MIKTKTVSLRLPSALIDELKQEAEIEKINFNALVSKILGNHILWEKYERKVGLLPMTKPFVKYAVQKTHRKRNYSFGGSNRKRHFFGYS